MTPAEFKIATATLVGSHPRIYVQAKLDILFKRTSKVTVQELKAAIDKAICASRTAPTIDELVALLRGSAAYTKQVGMAPCSFCDSTGFVLAHKMPRQRGAIATAFRCQCTFGKALADYIKTWPGTNSTFMHNGEKYMLYHHAKFEKSYDDYVAKKQ